MAIGADAGLDDHDDYDARDWWYRTALKDPREDPDSNERVRLRFDGLATLAEVWVNGTPVLQSDNMFVTYDVDVTDLLLPQNDIAIAFRSLRDAMSERRSRPRWKTRLVEDQKLRWFRTTLLGRIPAWTPAIRAVGPWRPIWLEVVSDMAAMSRCEMP